MLRAAPFLMLSLAACADQGEFPSLARRPVESASIDPPASPPQPPADAALAQRIAQARDTAEASRSAFTAALPPARIAAAAAGTSGSESWIAAQLEVSRLEATLEPLRTALASLDGERRGVVAAGNADDLAALEAAIGELEAIEVEQSREVAQLIGALNR